MNEQSQRKVNEAARNFAEALLESYANVTDFVSVQGINSELSRGFFDAVIDYLRANAPSNGDAPQHQDEQQLRQLKAAQVLAQDSASAYRDFLDSLFFYWSSTGSGRKEARPNQRSE